MLKVIVFCSLAMTGVLLVAAGSLAQQKGDKLVPTSLRCEYLVDPLAIDTREPRLSWVLQDSGTRGTRQTAYQIIVASSAHSLAASRGDLWDTGKVTSNQSVQIAYQGKPLGSRTQCYWKVRVWDQHGRPSAWSRPAQWTMGLLDVSDWSAQWIGDKLPSVGNVSATMLRRPFKLPAKVKRAVVYVTALGLYELHLNGRRVGDHLLAPEWTDYHTRVQYQAYDVTSWLQAGDNVIGAALGDGWYAGGIGLAQILLKKPRNIYGNHPHLLAQLEVELVNGQTQRIVTDGAWRSTREGPIRSADLLDGETYDARREMPGWDKPGFDDRAWQPAEVAARIDTKLVAQPNEPIRVVREIKPIALTEPKPGVFIFDLGQNMVGWCRLTAQGPAGSTVTIRHAEMLNDDGMIYTDNLRAAKEVDRYTLRGGGPEDFEPHFTYHGFRYVELTGLTAQPQLGDLTGRVFHSASPDAGMFTCSEPMLNKLWENILWTQRSNLHSIPTDCPQRDERLGWMGDILIFVQTGIFNLDMAAFFTKWVRDVRDAQADDGRYADFSPHPFGKNERFTGVPGWGDAGVLVPWRVYENYGDKRMLAEHYDSAKRWIEYIHRLNPDLIWRKGRGNDYGDWLNGDTLIQEGWPKKGGQVPKEIFATAIFAHSTDLLSRMAAVLGRTEEASKYAALFGDIKGSFNRAFVSADGRIQGDTQAGYALALHFDLLPEELRPLAVKHLVDGIAKYQSHISTGFQTTYRMMLELTREGQNDLAYRLINNRTFPSWGYTIENGATTIWERWDGYVKGRGFQDKGMNSFNHYAIGAVGEWMYRVILGLNPDDSHPGYEHFILRPRPGGGLTWAKGAYNSIRGQIACSWKLEGNSFKLDITVPANTTATVYVPAKDVAGVAEGHQPARQAAGVEFLRIEEWAAVFKVQAGAYHFEAH